MIVSEAFKYFKFPIECNSVDKKIVYIVEFIEQLRLWHNKNAYIGIGVERRKKNWVEMKNWFDTYYKIRMQTAQFILDTLLGDDGFKWDAVAQGRIKDKPILSDVYGVKETDIAKMDFLGITLANIRDPDEDIENNWTEVDPVTYLSASTVTANFTGIRRDIDAYFHRDLIVDGDYEHLFNAIITSLDVSSVINLWALANIVDDAWAIQSGAQNAMFIFALGNATPAPEFWLREVLPAANFNDTTTQPVNTRRWFKSIRNESIGAFGQAIVPIYSDAFSTLIAYRVPQSFF